MSLFKYDPDLLRAACIRHGMSVGDDDTANELFLKFTYRRAKDATASKEPMPATCLVYRTWAQNQHSNGAAVDASELAARWSFVLSTILQPDDVPMEHAIYNSLDANEKKIVEPVVWDEDRVYVRAKAVTEVSEPPAGTEEANDNAKRAAEGGEDDEEARRSKMRRAAEARVHVPAPH